MTGLLSNIQSVVNFMFVDSGIFTNITSMAESNSFVAIALMTLLVGFGVGLITRFISMVRG